MWLTAGTFSYIFGKSLQQYNTKKLCQYTPYIMKYQITTQLASDIHLKWSYLSIIRQIWKAVLTTTGGQHDYLIKATTSQNFTFLAFPLVVMHHQPISLHVHWSLGSAVHYIFTATTYYSTSLHLLISSASQQWKIYRYTD